METSDSSEWVIPQHKIMKKLDLMEIRIMKLTAEMNIYKETIEKQNILITGANSGLGLALTKKFLKFGNLKTDEKTENLFFQISNFLSGIQKCM